MCPRTLRVAALITFQRTSATHLSHPAVLLLCSKSWGKGQSWHRRCLHGGLLQVLFQRFAVLQLALWMDIQPSSSKNPRSGTWEPCKSGSSEDQKHETIHEHWSEKLSNSIMLGQYAVVNILFSTDLVKGGRE